ncbi:CDP-alcohol phosphatidyltransferase family protein [Streptomyces sp. NPDC049954]|uniref:CDP-alcohol phosphatidyltransferase family protein n=1 Tax=Streptomyces sp. NPDC049954 TaxID=3155779 RepID=UPI00343DDEEF
MRRITQKKRDAWWTVLLVDPVATPLVRFTARHTRISPNQITWAALVLGLGAAACFALGDWRWIALGAVIYHLSFILDCMDGKVARLTGRGSVFGAWLDYIFDRVRVAACAVALMAGQYHRTGETRYIWLAAVVVFCDGLRYINALEIFKTRLTMRKQIKSRIRAARRAENTEQVAFMEDMLRANPEADIEQDLRQAARAEDGAAVTESAADTGARDAESPYDLQDDTDDADEARDAYEAGGAESRYEAQEAQQAPDSAVTADSAPAAGIEGAEGVEGVARPARKKQVIDLQQEFRQRFPLYLRLRSFLLRRRIRAHLVSGIEFQMGVFIVGPLFDVVWGATLVSGVLLLLFELAIIYKLLLSTRDFGRTLASIPLPVPRAAEPEGTAVPLGPVAQPDRQPESTPAP